ncbi:hypothetical protein JS528_00665 [Bifidobacterium sp. MA2]|uniref:TraX protein n=1 Tax=Bifidobacterium santillanense TaxID=2809028 RepID=A0ABS5ULW8_9BIFI|nr:TraX family protein [Bifidobacterium santillanense]MBT1171894.1 hypothetical protein [Bifidobacterium santillanense]
MNGELSIRSGMTSFQLKILACVLMLIDHVAEFLPEMPVWMHWIGRLSAPIFFFLIGWSCMYTSNRKRFLLRLYLASVGMSLIQAVSYLLPPLSSGVMLNPIGNNIFATLFQMSLIICLLSAPPHGTRTTTQHLDLHRGAAHHRRGDDLRRLLHRCPAL